MRADDFRGTEEAIVMSGIEKSYKDLKVLDRIELRVQRGTVFALLGPNGAGKTTLIRILSTLLKPDAGRARVMGYDVVEQPEEVRKVISLTGQYAAVDELLTGAENMWMMGRLYHLSHADARRRTSELLEQFDLADAAHRMAKTYSGGMRRRLDLAISLIATPPILFLDEPTTGLDPRSRLTMWKLITDLLTSGVTVFLTTQYLEEADQLADKIALIDQGRIIAEGTAEQLKQQVGRERVELTFTRPHDFQSACRVLERQVVHADEQKNRISIVMDGSPRQLKSILDEMEQATIEVETLSLRKPTLDDVFLTITGRQTLEIKEGEGDHV
ncbi:MAG TPA: ATP-binding cassette domain-containing protein [Anaerolineales bacterium]|nr:ATP-binding cassette domain-containing protein [Anaerolineales bacterium]